MPDCRYLFVGGQSGVITIYNTKYNLAKVRHSVSKLSTVYKVINFCRQLINPLPHNSDF